MKSKLGLVPTPKIDIEAYTQAIAMHCVTHVRTHARARGIRWQSKWTRHLLNNWIDYFLFGWKRFRIIFFWHDNGPVRFHCYNAFFSLSPFHTPHFQCNCLLFYCQLWWYSIFHLLMALRSTFRLINEARICGLRLIITREAIVLHRNDDDDDYVWCDVICSTQK